MNSFPAMTEEQRQELIRHNRAKVNAITPQFLKESTPGVKKHLQREIVSAKIAIAALTAEPDHYVFHHPAGKLLNYLASDECKGQEHVVAGYTAPPAPVLRLPGEVSCEGLDPQEADEARNLGQCEGWNQCLAEVKRLNNQPAPPEASNEQ